MKVLFAPTIFDLIDSHFKLNADGMNRKLLAGVALISFLATGCTSVPDSVQIAVKKEGEAIDRVSEDYQISVNAYHSELLNQIDRQLDMIFTYEIQKMAKDSGSSLTPEQVLQLDQMRKDQRKLLHEQAEEKKKQFLGSRNLKVLKAVHQKIENFVESNDVASEDLGRLLEEIRPMMEQLTGS